MSVDNKKKTLEENGIKGVHMNIRNVKNKLEQFELFLVNQNQNYDFIILSENLITEKEARESMEWSKKKFKKNGEVAIAIHKKWEYVIEQDGEEVEADEITVKL